MGQKAALEGNARKKGQRRCGNRIKKRKKNLFVEKVKTK
jgi:hypothetical protein|tara:strand:- start:1162 stop:1278 length:117 start_codon:yes stop_codon:yes gene_type:complete